MSTAEITAMVCARCRKPILGGSVIWGSDGMRHPECGPQTWQQAWPPAPIDYDRIRQIVREEIAAAKGKK